MRNLLLFVVVFLICFSLTAQVNYPRDYFAPPIKGPITLAGNFGEIRPNHFHAGFDIRTNNKEGMPVYAVADGYVSRIKISAVGYGKALYITHPNGYVSVYGHMRGFNTAIQAKTFSLQTELQSFEIDTLLNRELLPVKKGDLIGFSGNTGSSQAPHLHFEIRNEQTEMPINPYFFGYDVKDDVKPTIVSLAVYPLGNHATINGKHQVKKIIPVKVNGTYIVPKADSLLLNGAIGFGINCYDKESAGSGTNNVFSIELKSGGKRIYYCEMETFTFDNARYVNAHIDYAEKQQHHAIIQKCFLAKNNPLEIYKGVQDRGIINFNDDADHWLTVIIKDYYGNASELALKVRSTTKNSHAPAALTTAMIYDCLKENNYGNDEVIVNFPAGALYDDLTGFQSKTLPAVKGTLSPVYKIGDEAVPLQKSIVMEIYEPNIPDNLKEKACVVSIDSKGKFNYEGGRLTKKRLLAESKHFGKFAISADTTPPKIMASVKPLAGDSIVDLRNLNVLRFKATDNLSGIKKYRATIDGSWVLCEYDEKSDLLFYTFDNAVQPGVHHFKLQVTDDKENTKEWKLIFKR
jgi:hypothetical protein